MSLFAEGVVIVSVSGCAWTCTTTTWGGDDAEQEEDDVGIFVVMVLVVLIFAFEDILLSLTTAVSVSLLLLIFIQRILVSTSKTCTLLLQLVDAVVDADGDVVVDNVVVAVTPSCTTGKSWWYADTLLLFVREVIKIQSFSLYIFFFKLDSSKNFYPDVSY